MRFDVCDFEQGIDDVTDALIGNGDLGLVAEVLEAGFAATDAFAYQDDVLAKVGFYGPDYFAYFSSEGCFLERSYHHAAAEAAELAALGAGAGIDAVLGSQFSEVCAAFKFGNESFGNFEFFYQYVRCAHLFFVRELGAVVSPPGFEFLVGDVHLLEQLVDEALDLLGFADHHCVVLEVAETC